MLSATPAHTQDLASISNLSPTLLCDPPFFLPPPPPPPPPARAKAFFVDLSTHTFREEQGTGESATLTDPETIE